MHHRKNLVVLLAGSLALGAAITAIAAAAPAPTPPAAGTPAPGAPAPLVILDFKPALDDMMNMLIQPRHIKVWAAAQQQNWTLAAFELNEMRTAFDRIAQTLPKYQNINLGPTFISMMSGPIMATNGAITAKNLAQFTTAYRDLTNTCSSCHQALNHPYLVIKVPDANSLSAYVDQDFSPAAIPK